MQTSLEAPQNNKVLFNSLVDLVSTDLYRYAFWACQDNQTAEDVVQETFIKIWKNIHQLREIDSAKAWVFTIFRREHARIFEKKAPTLLDIDTVPEDQLKNIYATDTTRHLLNTALNTLPNEYSDPLVLQIIGGFSCDEIAKILDISKPNVLTRIFRARKKIRSTLSTSKIELDDICGL